MQPIDPQEAARELRNEVKPRRRSIARITPVEKPVTAAETGLAISSMVIGIVLSLSTIPGVFMLGILAGGFVLAISLVPFAGLALGLGVAGRRSAMGIAGMVLSGLALVEALGVLGYAEYQKRQAHSAEMALEKERLKQETAARERANYELMKAQQDNERRAAEAKIEAEKAKQAQAVRDVELTKIAETQRRAAAEEEKRVQAAWAEDQKRREADEAERRRAIAERDMKAKLFEKQPVKASTPQVPDVDEKPKRLAALTTEMKAAEQRLSDAKVAARRADYEIKSYSAKNTNLAQLDPRPQNYDTLVSANEAEIQKQRQRLQEQTELQQKAAADIDRIRAQIESTK